MNKASPRRIALLLALAGAVWAMAAPGWAQVVMNSPGTVAGGNMMGMSDVISSAGEYNLATSQAAMNMSQVQAQEIKNRMEGSKTYYELRDMNEAWQKKQRGPHVPQKDMNEYLQKMCPKKLQPNQLNPDGRISWPSVFGLDVFADDRGQVDALFVKRAEQGGLGFEDQTQVRALTKSMLDELKQIIRQIPSDAYVPAKNFLQSLTQEANFSG
jgi:hypothetical protein